MCLVLRTAISLHAVRRHAHLLALFGLAGCWRLLAAVIIVNDWLWDAGPYCIHDLRVDRIVVRPDEQAEIIIGAQNQELYPIIGGQIRQPFLGCSLLKAKWMPVVWREALT